MRYKILQNVALCDAMNTLISEARRFAKQAHETIDHRRKYTNAPYIVHPAAVAKLVATVTDDEAMICAAWLHDVVEDTNITLNEIREKFGEDVAALVADLTDISKSDDGNRKIRKQIDLEHTRNASPRAKTVKLADLIDNSRTIMKYDPQFAKVYMEEKGNLLMVLKEGDKRLYSMAKKMVDEFKSHNKHMQSDAAEPRR